MYVCVCVCVCMFVCLCALVTTTASAVRWAEVLGTVIERDTRALARTITAPWVKGLQASTRTHTNPRPVLELDLLYTRECGCLCFRVCMQLCLLYLCDCVCAAVRVGRRVCVLPYSPWRIRTRETHTRNHKTHRPAVCRCISVCADVWLSPTSYGSLHLDNLGFLFCVVCYSNACVMLVKSSASLNLSSLNLSLQAHTQVHAHNACTSASQLQCHNVVNMVRGITGNNVYPTPSQCMTIPPPCRQ